MTAGRRRPRNGGGGSAPGDADQADARRPRIGRGPPAVTSDPAAGAVGHADELGALLALLARGDQGAYEAAFDRTAGQVLGTVLAVVRDPAQPEEGPHAPPLALSRSPTP